MEALFILKVVGVFLALFIAQMVVLGYLIDKGAEELADDTY